jgi:hypothetical protein
MSPLPRACNDALVRFERFNDLLEMALDAEDCERVAAVVEARGEAVSALVSAFADTVMPDALRERLERDELRIRGRIVKLYDRTLRALTEERRRQKAATSYAEAAR